MNINFDKMGNCETEKMIKLLNKARDLGWELNDYGEAGVNSSSGNVYIWSEREPYTLFIDLGNDLMACKTDYETGEEEFMSVDIRDGETSRFDLEDWAHQTITE